MLNNTQPFEFGDEEVGDELPGYDAETAPLYDQLGFDLPVWTYHLRQVNRKLQILVPFGPTCDTSYKIVFRTTLNILSKKPDITLNCVSPKLPKEITVATMDFNNDSPLPWYPRATFRRNIMNTELDKTYYMEARNFSDWKVSIGEVSFFWHLEHRPFTLVFSEGCSRVAIARFTYSECGTTATNGAEVGQLAIYRHNLSKDNDGLESIICSCSIAITHFRRMGRHYRNDTSSLRSSLARSRMPPNVLYGDLAFTVGGRHGLSPNMVVTGDFG
jgi:hypothetical protein